ncbi:MAG: GNAT family N-acetyltransferase [Ruminococcus sp.]|nr:GNAT family N-acetyltransferase [Ruminococcus sp.]
MSNELTFEPLTSAVDSRVDEMSALASAIIKDYYDPLLGAEQNDYMIEMFQSPTAIRSQLSHGYRYRFIRKDGMNIGFLAMIPHEDAMYLSKLYLHKDSRGKGYGRTILAYIKEQAESEGFHAIELNVNKENETKYIYEKLGFVQVRAEKNDIGGGFYMDDYVYRLEY